MSTETCFICKRTGAKVCDGHCGLCMESDEPLGEDAKPNERMFRCGTFGMI